LSAIVEMTNAFSAILWSLVGIIGALLVLWFLYQILQVGKNIREYGNDYVGFLRGEIHKAGEEEGIDILRPQRGIKDRRSRFKKILEKEQQEKKG